MKARTFLLLAAVVFIVIFICHKIALYYYWGALVLTVTYLNSKPGFKQEPYRLYNALFFVYLLFVVWERTRHYMFSPFMELQINNLEHILFGVMICFISNLCLKLPPFRLHGFLPRLLLSILIFNCIGFINEWFQNTLQHRPIFVLIPDSLKDLRMNLWGTLAFVVVSLASLKIKRSMHAANAD